MHWVNLALLMSSVRGFVSRSGGGAFIRVLKAATNGPTDYEFLDCGNQRRLERFGKYLVARNCPSAIWAPGLASDVWGSVDFQHNGEQWIGIDSEKDLDKWKVLAGPDLLFGLAPSDQGQVGIFPEQQDQWQWINKALSVHECPIGNTVRVLNGFAYTGGSTMAALSGRKHINVTHLDASTSAVNWASRNVASSSLVEGGDSDGGPQVRFIVEDCTTFLKREIKRGKKYDALIFDPPAFGRGGGNKIWKLKKDLPVLVDLLSQLLSDHPVLLLLSCHDPDWGPKDLQALLQSCNVPKGGLLECGDMRLTPAQNGRGKALPLGCFARYSWPT